MNNNRSGADFATMYTDTEVQLDGGGERGGSLGLGLLSLLMMLLASVGLGRRKPLARNCAIAIAACLPLSTVTAQNTPTFYGELGLGRATSSWNEANLEQTFQQSAQEVTVQDSDDQRTTSELLVGYRFTPHVAAELGYRDWGQISYRISAIASAPDAVTQAVQTYYPASGSGAFAGVRASYWHGDMWEGYAKLSAWRWSGDYSVSAGDSKTEFELDGTDLVFSLGVSGYFLDRYSVGLIYKTVELEGQRNRMFGGVVGYQF